MWAARGDGVDVITRPEDLGTIELVEAIVGDTRALVGAQVETLRADMGERFSALGSALTSTLLAFSIMIVTALLLGLALAETIIALGMPTWAAFWIVSLSTAILGYGLVQRARRIASAATSSTNETGASDPSGS